MFSGMALRAVLRSSAGVLRDLSSAVRPWSCGSSVLTAPRVGAVSESFAAPPPIRHYSRGAKKIKKTDPVSHLSDLHPTMLKMDYAALPLAQTTDDVVRRLLSLEFGSHTDKLQLKREQLVAKVRRDEHDTRSVEVQVAVLTSRILNYQEHLQKHHKDKANKRRMLMAIDQRAKVLKRLRLVDYEAFQKVCKQLNITYTFPPQYFRRITRRWLAKKALAIKVYQEVKRRKKEAHLLRKKRSLVATQPKEAKTEATTQ